MIPDGTKSAELADVELAAWRGMLRVHHRVRSELGAELQRRHDLSMADYDVLVRLAERSDGRMRMSDLAESVLQPRSSLTRIAGGLEERGYLVREASAQDGRGAEAALTKEGRAVFKRAQATHLEGVRERFLDRLSDAQLMQLAEAWGAVEPATKTK